MFRQRIIIIVFTCMAGCTVISVHPTITTQIDKTLPEATKYFVDQAEKCWKKKSTFVSDGRVINSRNISHEEVEITVTRYASDIPVQRPFIFLTLKQNGDVTNIDVMEGGEGYTYNDFSKDITRWSKGDIAC